MNHEYINNEPAYGSLQACLDIDAVDSQTPQSGLSVSYQWLTHNATYIVTFGERIKSYCQLAMDSRLLWIFGEFLTRT